MMLVVEEGAEEYTSLSLKAANTGGKNTQNTRSYHIQTNTDV